MITKLSHASVFVLDQESAKDFYTGKLGFEVREDTRVGSFRRLTVGSAGQSELEIVLMWPGPPQHDPETERQIRELRGQRTRPAPRYGRPTTAANL